MERVRQAMERALEEKWVATERPEALAPVARRRTVRRSDDGEPKAPREGFGYAPIRQETFERNALVAAIDGSEHREAYSVLQANVDQRMENNGWRTLGVTSPATGSGKTLTAINLAISLAKRSTNKVLLIDLDLQNPGIRRAFEHESKLGLEDCLFDGAALSEAAFKPAIDDLAVLTIRGDKHNAIQVLGSESLRNFMDTIKRDYPDYLIIADLPAVANADYARAITSLVDGALVVVEDTVTKEAHLRRALDLLNKASVIGTVLNRAVAAAQ